MDKNILKTVILDNQVEVPKYKVIPRDFVFEDFGNYVFVGIRRAGKTFLLYQRIQQLLAQGVHWDEMIYINFEDERLGGNSHTKHSRQIGRKGDRSKILLHGQRHFKPFPFGRKYVFVGKHGGSKFAASVWA